MSRRRARRLSYCSTSSPCASLSTGVCVAVVLVSVDFPRERHTKKMAPPAAANATHTHVGRPIIFLLNALSAAPPAPSGAPRIREGSAIVLHTPAWEMLVRHSCLANVARLVVVSPVVVHRGVLCRGWPQCSCRGVRRVRASGGLTSKHRGSVLCRSDRRLPNTGVGR